jgi:hypothetical protein
MLPNRKKLTCIGGFVYGSLVNVQVMAAVTVTEGVSSADAELTIYLGKACDFINDSLKAVVSVPLDPVPAVVDTIAEVYASGLYLARTIFLTTRQSIPTWS